MNELMERKTLVIHPDDRSTDFLKLIYEGKDYSVQNFVKDDDHPSSSIIMKEQPEECKEFLREIIPSFDRIIMLGHGSPYGLFNPKTGGYLIDDSFKELLQEKESISIWCHSDRFFRRNGIFRNEFHSGMIISEVMEQLFVLGKVYLDKEEQLKNMEKFSRVVGECIDYVDHNAMKTYILDHYTGKDPVTEYNRENILVF